MATTEQLRCARCGRFIGEDCLEGHDGSFYGPPGAEDGYTGVYYCAAGVGCNAEPCACTGANYHDANCGGTCGTLRFR